MADPYLLFAMLLLAAATVGLVRILTVSGRIEQLLALQLLGTTIVAVVLLLAQGADWPGLRDLALVLGLLASVVAIAFVQFGGIVSRNRGEK